MCVHNFENHLIVFLQHLQTSHSFECKMKTNSMSRYNLYYRLHCCCNCFYLRAPALVECVFVIVSSDMIFLYIHYIFHT